jgi:DNA-binding NtrC family response regulator
MIRILVIDDDRHMRHACMRALSTEGWLVIGAETGDEGLRQLRITGQKIDMVLLDQLMPGMSGTEALNQIRALDPNLPVVIMTGFITEESVLDLKNQGAFECLAKPFTPDQLREVVRRAVGKEV